MLAFKRRTWPMKYVLVDFRIRSRKLSICLRTSTISHRRRSNEINASSRIQIVILYECCLLTTYSATLKNGLQNCSILVSKYIGFQQHFLISSAAEGELVMVTAWIVGDLDDPKATELVHEALLSLVRKQRTWCTTKS